MDNNSKTVLADTPKVDIADIFKKYQHLLGSLSQVEAKAVKDIIECRTENLGGNILQCETCGNKEYHYHSCGNRHCPKCQTLDRIAWVDARTNELLPVDYYHVVFTVPHLFNNLILWNKKLLYSILFQATSETLKEVAEKRLKIKIGLISVLHTWGQDLSLHPHVHIIVPGGGINIEDEKKWISCRKGFFLPNNILIKVFRGKFLSILEKAYLDLVLPKDHKELKILRDQKNFKSLLIKAAKKEWIVYAKKPFAGPEQVLKYLGNYTHRIAISNYRIIKLENDNVYFFYKDYKTGEKNKVKILPVKEFMRKFLLHILPSRFIRIRHCGFLGNRFKKENIALIKEIFDETKNNKEGVQKKTWEEKLKELTGIDIYKCKACEGNMRLLRIIKSTNNNQDRRKGYSISGILKKWDSS